VVNEEDEKEQDVDSVVKAGYGTQDGYGTQEGFSLCLARDNIVCDVDKVLRPYPA